MAIFALVGVGSMIAIQSRDNRAINESALFRAVGDQTGQGSVHALKLFDLVTDFLSLGRRLGAYILAIGRRIGAQREQVRNFAQRKAKLLRFADKTNALDDVGRILPERSVGAPRLLDKAPSFIVADRFDIDARLARHPSYCQRFHCHDGPSVIRAASNLRTMVRSQVIGMALPVFFD